jgi:two-component system KDP operon response regulator KdpE
MSRVLVVDDEAPMRRTLDIGLRAGGYEVALAATGEEALALAGRDAPDAVILDLGLPGIDGIQVAKGLRGWSAVPIIVLSARGTESVKVAALDAGADDYVTKPFGMDELLARLRAALRRANPAFDITTIRTPDFAIDLLAKTVTGPTGDLRLTPTEWQILELLVRNRGRLVSQGRLLRDVWGPEYRNETHYLRVYMSQLRRKLEPDPAHPRYFITEPGMGYRLMLDDE